MCSDRARFQYHLFFTSKIRQINIQIRPFDSWVNVKFAIDAFEFGMTLLNSSMTKSTKK